MSTESQDPTILIVDDEPEMHRFLAIGLAKHGSWRLEHAYDGVQGLSAIQDKRPDLVLLDCAMPGMDGQEMLIALRKDPKTRELPVIALSSLETKTGDFLSLGAVAYLTKPFKFEELISEILRALRRGHGRHA